MSAYSPSFAGKCTICGKGMNDIRFDRCACEGSRAKRYPMQVTPRTPVDHVEADLGPSWVYEQMAPWREAIERRAMQAGKTADAIRARIEAELAKLTPEQLSRTRLEHHPGEIAPRIVTEPELSPLDRALLGPSKAVEVRELEGLAPRTAPTEEWERVRRMEQEHASAPRCATPTCQARLDSSKGIKTTPEGDICHQCAAARIRASAERRCTTCSARLAAGHERVCWACFCAEQRAERAREQEAQTVAHALSKGWTP